MFFNVFLVFFVCSIYLFAYIVILRERELCAVSALAGLDVPSQLVSHIRGSLKVGCSQAEVEAVIAQLFLVWGDNVQEQADAVLMTFRNARYGQ
jgi:hypothetical protein